MKSISRFMTAGPRLGLTLLLVGVAIPVFLPAPVSAQADAYVVLARHAEKQEGDDPDLTEAGRVRAAALTHALSAWPIEAVFSSQFLRTRATAAPLAEQFGVEPIVTDARDVRGLAGRIREEWRGAVVVVGHSNTVPAIARALGATDVPDIPEHQYDDLFVVRLSEDAAHLLRFKYGEPSPRVAPTK